MSEEGLEDDLRDRSDRLLSQIRELKVLETRKRQEDVGTPEFHALVEAVDEKSREIFRTVEEQSALADRFATPRDVSIDDV